MAAGSIRDRVKHWIFRSRKKDCRSFCLFCEYWDICRNDKGDQMKRRRLTKAERKIIHEKCSGRCAYCGCALKYKAMQVDHVIPLSNGGEDTLENMLPSCRSCNHYKGMSGLEDFRRHVENMPGVLMRDSVTYKNAVRFGLVKPDPHPVVFYFEKMAAGR